MLSFKGVADHITQKTGVEIKEHSVRRCPEVREYYDSLQENTEPMKPGPNLMNILKMYPVILNFRIVIIINLIQLH